jgi:hypothetical protein
VRTGAPEVAVACSSEGARLKRFELLTPGFAGQGDTPGSGHKGRTFRKSSFRLLSAQRQSGSRASRTRQTRDPVHEQAVRLRTRNLPHAASTSPIRPRMRSRSPASVSPSKLTS